MQYRFQCQKCGQETSHFHLHDIAHGLIGTHMAGSERFECHLCGHKTYASDPGAASFPFICDKPCPPTPSPNSKPT